MYTLTRAEQETIIRWDAQDRTAFIDTADPATIRKMDKLAAQYPDAYKCVHVDDAYLAKRYELPAQYVRFGKPASDAVREASRIKARHFKEERPSIDAILEGSARLGGGLRPQH